MSTADDAAMTGTVALLSYDTTVATNPNDTARRAAAAGYLTPGFAAAVDSFRPAGSPGSHWADWAAHQAQVRVDVRIGGDDHPPDTPTSAYRRVIATLTPVGRDGWTGTPVTKVVALTLARNVGGSWLVAIFTTA